MDNVHSTDYRCFNRFLVRVVPRVMNHSKCDGICSCTGASIDREIVGYAK